MKKFVYIFILLLSSISLFAQSNHQTVFLSSSELHIYNVYPNPLPQGNEIVLDFYSDYSLAIDVSVTDLLGNIVLEKSIDAKTGKHLYRLDTKNLNYGIYFIHIFDGKEKQVQRFIIK